MSPLLFHVTVTHSSTSPQQVESVDLALQILDGSMHGHKNGRITVERAKFQMKGEYNASLKPKKKRKKIVDKMQKKQEK